MDRILFPPGHIREGFRFQDYYTLWVFVNWLKEPGKYRKAWIEAKSFGSLNDLVMLRNDGIYELYQLKHSAKKDGASKFLDLSQLIKTSPSKRSKSLLQKWFDSWRNLSKNEQFKIIITTNRKPEFPSFKNANVSEELYQLNVDVITGDLYEKLSKSCKKNDEVLKHFFQNLYFKFETPSSDILWEASERIFLETLGGTQKGFEGLCKKIQEWGTCTQVGYEQQEITLEQIQEVAFYKIITRKTMISLCRQANLREIKLYYPKPTLQEIEKYYVRREIDDRLEAFADPWNQSHFDIPKDPCNLGFIMSSEKDFDIEKYHIIREALLDAMERRIFSTLNLKIGNMSHFFNSHIKRQEIYFQPIVHDVFLSWIEKMNNLIQNYPIKLGLLNDPSGCGKTWCLIRFSTAKENCPILFVSGKNKRFFLGKSLEESLSILLNACNPDYKFTEERIKTIFERTLIGEEFLVLIIDGIDNQNDMALIQDWVYNVFQGTNIRFKLIVSCRDIYWNRYEETFMAFCQGKYWKLPVMEFSNEEVRKVFDLYFQGLHTIDPEKVPIPLHLLRNPIFLNCYLKVFQTNLRLTEPPKLPFLFKIFTQDLINELIGNAKGMVSEEDVKRILLNLARLSFLNFRKNNDEVQEKELKKELTDISSEIFNSILIFFENKGFLIRAMADDFLLSETTISYFRQDYLEFSLAVFIYKEIKRRGISTEDCKSWLKKFPGYRDHPNSPGITLFLLAFLGKASIEAWLKSGITFAKNYLFLRQLFLYIDEKNSYEALLPFLIREHISSIEDEQAIKKSHYNALIPLQPQEWNSINSLLHSQLSIEIVEYYKKEHGNSMPEYFDSLQGADESAALSLVTRSFCSRMPEKDYDMVSIGGKLVGLPRKFLQTQDSLSSFWINFFPKHLIPLIRSNLIPKNYRKILLEIALGTGDLNSLPATAKYFYVEELYSAFPELDKKGPYLKALFINDNENIIILIKHILSRSFPLKGIYLGFEFLKEKEVIEKNKYDLLITDIRGSGLDGIELIKIFKQQPGEKRAILCTAERWNDNFSEKSNLVDAYFVTSYTFNNVSQIINGVSYSFKKFRKGLRKDIYQILGWKEELPSHLIKKQLT